MSAINIGSASFIYQIGVRIDSTKKFSKLWLSQPEKAEYLHLRCLYIPEVPLPNVAIDPSFKTQHRQLVKNSCCGIDNVAVFLSRASFLSHDGVRLIFSPV